MIAQHLHKVESIQGPKVANKKKERNKNNTNTKHKQNRKKAGVKAGMNQKL